MEDNLTKAKLTPIIDVSANVGQPSKTTRFEDLSMWAEFYGEIKEHKAWKDFIYRISQLRAATQQQILTYGGLDKSANSHDIELRAVLHVLNTILGYVPAMNQMYEEMLEKRSEQEAKLAKRGPIHGKEFSLSQGTRF